MDQKQYEYNAGRVSIVTPVYNGETHLAKMLDSVLAQTYPDVEMILVDDGSADGTVRAAQNYSEKFEEKGYGYRIVRAEHKNASAAINRGLPFVSGEYLIWPDSGIHPTQGRFSAAASAVCVRPVAVLLL